MFGQELSETYPLFSFASQLDYMCLPLFSQKLFETYPPFSFASLGQIK